MTTVMVLVVLFVLVVFYLLRHFSVSDKKGAGRIGSAGRLRKIDLSKLPQTFVVFDLETTGLDPAKDEIIEIAAIKFDRNSEGQQGLQALVQPSKPLPKKITQLTGISQGMIEKEGEPLNVALKDFAAFIGDLPLVAFNADFDMAFLRNAAKRCGLTIDNSYSCALKAARRAWPRRKSYRLCDLAEDAKITTEGSHRALEDCKRTLIIYAAAMESVGGAGSHRQGSS